jgi:hypothetical protein
MIKSNIYFLFIFLQFRSRLDGRMRRPALLCLAEQSRFRLVNLHGDRRKPKTVKIIRRRITEPPIKEISPKIWRPIWGFDPKTTRSLPFSHQNQPPIFAFNSSIRFLEL